MKVNPFRAHVVRAAISFCFAAFSISAASAAIIFTDGFGDGDRDNNGLDAGAAATDPSDIGIPWYFTDGTSAAVFAVTDDSAGIGSGNALRLHNTGSNNRPTIGKFPAVTMVDGSRLILRFDARLVAVTTAAGAETTADRSIRFGLYHDAGANNNASDTGSGGTLSLDDVGYNVRVDAGADVSNATSMDVTRDDSTAATIIQGTTTGIGVSSTNAINQLLTSTLKAHFELTLERSGSSLIVTLQRDANAALSNTDATPTGFTFDEVALGVRSSAATDMRFDNVQVEYIVPEPCGLMLAVVAAGGLAMRRRR